MSPDDRAAAMKKYQAILDADPRCEEAIINLYQLRLPGDDYLVWLSRIYEAVQPSSVIEIGVFSGRSLAVVPPSAIAIGIDPQPQDDLQLLPNARFFRETSEEFFARKGPRAILGGNPLSVGFIDGMHQFDQVLREFIHLETWCDRNSVIMIHDTFPLTELTQRRAMELTCFWTGDVWKAVLCLRQFRPDLDIFTIATPPSGLTVVTGLDPNSTVLTRDLSNAVSDFLDMPYTGYEEKIENGLDLIPNDWNVVQERLRRGGVLR